MDRCKNLYISAGEDRRLSYGMQIINGNYPTPWKADMFLLGKDNPKEYYETVAMWLAFGAYDCREIRRNTNHLRAYLTYELSMTGKPDPQKQRAFMKKVNSCVKSGTSPFRHMRLEELEGTYLNLNGVYKLIHCNVNFTRLKKELEEMSNEISLSFPYWESRIIEYAGPDSPSRMHIFRKVPVPKDEMTTKDFVLGVWRM